MASLGGVDQLLGTTSALRDGTTPLPEGGLAVELDAVSFGYDAELVLHDVSIRLGPGRVLGVLRRTGGGKTTRARPLLRRDDPMARTAPLGRLARRYRPPARSLQRADLRRAA